MECEGDFSSEAVISVGAVRSKQTFGAASRMIALSAMLLFAGGMAKVRSRVRYA